MPSPEEQVSGNSRPSQLKITDLRTATVGWDGWRFTLIRIDTNQGLSGYGEVRDGASKTYALMLKNRLLGENPCNVDKLFRKIKQFGHHARQGGGVCGVEMALMDLAGKAYGVPAYALAGGKFRDRGAHVLRHAQRAHRRSHGPQTAGAARSRASRWSRWTWAIAPLIDVPGALSFPAGVLPRDRRHTHRADARHPNHPAPLHPRAADREGPAPAGRIRGRGAPGGG